MTKSSTRVRIALAGVGAFGRRYAAYLRSRPEFELVAAADPAPAAGVHVASLGIPHFADCRRMIAAVRPDGIVIATPNSLHEEGALAAIEAGVPALIEKPVADRIEAARRIASAASARGVKVLAGHHRRHNPLLKAAKAFIDQGALGRMLAVTAIDLRRKPSAYYDAAWRREPGGGPLLINGIHDLDCLRWLCGEIDSVYAVTANRARGFPVEDTGGVTLSFRNGAIGTLTISDAVQAPWAWEIASGEEPDYPHQLEDCYLIGGTEGALAIPTLTHWRNERGGGRGDPFISQRLHYVPADPWLAQLLHFAEVVRGTAEPLVTIEEGARTLAVAHAIARSAESGLPVSPDALLQHP
mgnify:CR=1 FL=1